jgi:predicted nucleotidyltransferase
MVPVIKENMDEIVKLCRQNNVARLELFGSAAYKERFDASKSDLDFLIEFQPDCINNKNDYFGMLFGLEDLLCKKIDLVMNRAIKNRFFRQAIEQNKELVYAT